MRKLQVELSTKDDAPISGLEDSYVACFEAHREISRAKEITASPNTPGLQVLGRDWRQDHLGEAGHLRLLVGDSD